jgi:hypothetical protein
VNVSNTMVVKNVNITNVYNTVYVNKTVYVQHFSNAQAPNAVTSMPQAAFASGRPVRQAGVAVAPLQIQRMKIETASVVAPPVVPTRQSLLASNVNARVVRPPMAVTTRKVVVRVEPVVAPAPFAAREAYLQHHIGQPHDFTEMHRQSARQGTPQMARVVMAPPGRPMSVPPAQPKPAERAAPTAPNARRQPQPATHLAESARPEPHQQPIAKQPIHAGYPERAPHRVQAAPEHVNKPPARPEHKEKEKEKNQKDR